MGARCGRELTLYVIALADGTCRILSKMAFEELGEEKITTTLIGSGPYLLKEWTPRERRPAIFPRSSRKRSGISHSGGCRDMLGNAGADRQMPASGRARLVRRCFNIFPVGVAGRVSHSM